MLGIGQKIAFAFAGLLALLCVVSAVSINQLTTHSGTLSQIFRENYDSVSFGQGMHQTLEHLDELADEASLEEHADPTALSSLATLAASFETHLANERGNITLPTEADVVSAIDARWPAYRASLKALLETAASAERRSMRDARLQPLSAQLKADIQTIIDLNLQNILSADGQVQQAARTAKRTLYLFTAAGVFLAVVLAVVMSRSILEPLRSLTTSAQEIERGNLDLLVRVRGRDELAQLAEAFNAMAARLRAFRRSDRAKLVRTQRATQLAVRSLPDAVALVSPDGTVELANDTAQRLFGLRPDIRLDSLGEPRLVELDRRSRSEGRPIVPSGYESAIQRFDERGEERFFLPRAIPILDGDSLVGVTLVLADVTPLRKLDELKSGLLSVVSHELKTPLTGIRMATHLLLDERVGPLTTKQTELLIAARDDSDRLHSIIENLLEIGRMESGRASIELEPIAPRQLVDAATEELDASYRDKGVTLTVAIVDDIPPVLADADRIGHVFTNLLVNALRYTASGGSVRIDVEHDSERHLVSFAVQDTGTGISPEHLPRVFDRFFRVPGQPGRTGVGLGLAIAKEIVIAHGGTIVAESEPGKGSRFRFTLAAVTVAAGAAPPPGEDAARRT